MRPSRIEASEFLNLLHETIPLARLYSFKVEELRGGFMRMRLHFDANQVRAGGTLSGPTLMTLADTALYGAVLSEIGMAALAVTTDLSFRFLRRPSPVDLIAEASLLALHPKLAVGQVFLYSDGREEPVAHATGSYAIPSSHR